MKTIRHPASPGGFALVVVLSFLVLLLVVALAFFSRSAAQRQISASSAARVKTEMLARQAINTIIGDLRAEIADGSTAVTKVAGGVTNIIYYPKTPRHAVPELAGSTGAGGLENLVKRSASGVPFYTGGPGRASPMSTADPDSSADGRYITAARWNKPLFMQPTATNDPTPVAAANFVPPDWIYVQRDGTTATTPSPDVVGRFAYAIYDEGGLLDANVAGYPQGNTTVSQTAVYKSALAYADLTRIGLTGNQIDDLVNWRNKASLDGDPANFVTYVARTTNGFLTTGNTKLAGDQSDQFFTSRRQLIEFVNTQLGGSDNAATQNSLQYLTHFSRALEQPSFAPATNRPTILALASGGSDATGGDNVINPRFLEVRVSSEFTRNDGSTAAPGEPLVKRRFPLPYLAWLTFEGPSASASTTTKAALENAGLPAELIERGTAANIANYFGLTWSGGRWIYRQGENSPIKTLGTIAGREADFFELIKASIVAGSLGKAYSNSGAAASTPEGYQQQRDNSIDAQIMQIAANIIDQADPDGYPTVIVFNDGTLFGGRDLEYRGVEDLPYLYRVREGKVMTRDSDPPQSELPQVGGTLADPGEGAYMLQPEIWNPHAIPASAAGPRPTRFRLVAATLDPVTDTPTAFTLGVKWRTDITNSTVPLAGPTGALTTLNATMTFEIPSARQDLFRHPTLLIKPGIPTGSNLSGPANYTLGPATVFTAAYQYGTNGIPDNMVYTGIPMGTLPMAFTATIRPGGITAEPPLPAQDTNGIAPTGFVYYPTSGNASPFPYVTYRLQCETPNGWVTYDEKYASAPTATSFNIPSNSFGGGNIPGNVRFQFNKNKTFYRMVDQPWSISALGSQMAVASFDPRTSRFGMLFCGSNGRGRMSMSLTIPLTSPVRYWLDERNIWSWSGWVDAEQNAVMTSRPDEYQGAVFSALNTVIHTAFGLATGPSAGGWEPPGGTNAVVAPGLSSQNNPNIGAFSDKTRYTGDRIMAANGTPQYFADADGVVRRAMAAHVPPDGTIPALAPAAGEPSGLPMKTNDNASRPVVLNRPFRSVSELGYVFSGTPWRNLDSSTPESGAAPLFDVFSVAEAGESSSLTAGKVNLNTRQPLVLQSILSGAYRDELGSLSAMGTGLASAVSDSLAARTRSTDPSQGPLINVSDLVGNWFDSSTVGNSINGSRSYVGFTSDLVANANDLTVALDAAGNGTAEQRVSRLREAAVRPLLAVGQTRVWNLMVDVIVQSGRFPASATGLGQFVVEGERRSWVHLAIDRLTGEVLDRQTEGVRE